MAKARTGDVVFVTNSPAKPMRVLEGKALINDMARWGEEASSTHESAMNLLINLGVMTKGGKRKTLIRD